MSNVILGDLGQRIDVGISFLVSQVPCSGQSALINTLLVLIGSHLPNMALNLLVFILYL